MLALHPQDAGGCPDAQCGDCSQEGPAPTPGLSGRYGGGTAIAVRDWSGEEQNPGQDW